MAQKKKKGKILFTTLKVIVSVGLIAILIAQMDLNALQKVLASVTLWFLALAVFFMFIELVLMSIRLYVLLLMKELHVPFFILFKLNLVSVFVGIFLPSALGFDALRVFYLSKHTNHVVDSISLVTLDRFLNMVSITLFAIFSFFLGGYFRKLSGLWIAILPMLFGIGFVFLFMSKRIRSFIRGALKRVRMPEKVINWIGSLVGSFYECRAFPRLLLLLFGLAIVFQATRTTTSYFFAQSVDIDVSFIYFFIIIPIVTVLSMLPFSIAGIGVPQYSSVYLFELVGVDMESVLGFSIVIYVARILITLPGLYFFYREGFDSLLQSVSKTKFFPFFKRRKVSMEVVKNT
ncbi:MAG: lysylphosphatidylglycerol synthase transmembrane domain-containing protein [Bacteroidetes bacterium]|nr:lysylphosphatidylglycerol synthase transmembrane domain-containing protein [Bacteroidota bacterium]